MFICLETYLPRTMIDSIILGLVEGATEFLPVSSTGHLLVAESLMGSQRSEAFNVLVQVGPILASALVLRNRLFRWVSRVREKQCQQEILHVLVAFLLTGLGGLALQKAGMKLPETILPVAIATLVGAPVIFLIERRAIRQEGASSSTWPMVFAVSAAQLIAAAFPGTSRSGACVMAALLVGVARPVAVEFSFLVGIPTMLAAGGYKLLKEAKTGGLADLANLDTALAFLTATLVAIVVVRWLLGYVRSNTFLPFAWYRLALGLGLLGWAAL